MKFRQNNVGITLGSIFTLIGLTFILVGIVTTVKQISFNSKMPKTTAVITQITGSQKSHTVWIEYTVDGTVYNDNLGYYSSSMRKGDEVTIHYDPEDPRNFQKGTLVVNLSFSGVGVIFGGVGAICLVSDLKKRKERKQLMKNGIAMYATVTNVIMDRSTTANNRHPYMIECEVFDQYTGERFVYRSESCFNDLYQFTGASVPVYIDPSDPHKAFVDVQALVEDSRI